MTTIVTAFPSHFSCCAQCSSCEQLMWNMNPLLSYCRSWLVRRSTQCIFRHLWTQTPFPILLPFAISYPLPWIVSFALPCTSWDEVLFRSSNEPIDIILKSSSYSTLCKLLHQAHLIQKHLRYKYWFWLNLRTLLRMKDFCLLLLMI